jgi:hypothetical protein
MFAARAACAALLVGATLVVAGPAAAATPQETSQRIFADLADNGRLDGKYTRGQVDRALRTPSLKGYEAPAASTPASNSASLAPASESDWTIPFSGLDFALFAAVSGPLLLLGGSLGRIARLRVES